MVDRKEQWIGSDRVLMPGDRLIIESPIAMDGWDVRTYRRLLVRFAGRAWTPRRIEPTAHGSVRYELAPWSPAPLEILGDEVDYGIDYVERRDRAAASRTRRARAGLVLNMLSPLVGLLPAQLKGRIEERFGIGARAATVRCVAIEALSIGPALTIVLIEFLAGAITGQSVGLPVRTCGTIALVCGLDVMVRWDRLLAEEYPPPGFYEWAWRWRRKSRCG